eukprot:6913758-Prymnesium_polylepis.1
MSVFFNLYRASAGIYTIQWLERSGYSMRAARVPLDYQREANPQSPTDFLWFGPQAGPNHSAITDRVRAAVRSSTAFLCGVNFYT